MSEALEVRLVARGPAARCAWCHDALRGGEPGCGECGVALHLACAARAARCPTLGCQGWARPAPRARERAAPSRLRRAAPILGALLLPLALVLGLARGLARFGEPAFRARPDDGRAESERPQLRIRVCSALPSYEPACVRTPIDPRQQPEAPSPQVGPEPWVDQEALRRYRELKWMEQR